MGITEILLIALGAVVCVAGGFIWGTIRERKGMNEV